MFPCCWFCSGSPAYIQLDDSDASDSDSDGELTEVVVASAGVTSGPTGEDSDEDPTITDEALAHTESAYRGIFYAEESISFISIGYAVLRVCNYAQLYMMEHVASRVERSLEDGGPPRTDIDINVLGIDSWAAQGALELGVLALSHMSCVRGRIAWASYTGTRITNVVFSLIDLSSQMFFSIREGISQGRDRQSLHNLLALTDVLTLTNEAIYFCLPTIQRIQGHLSEGTGIRYLTRLCSSWRGARDVVRGALNRLGAITGTIGLVGTASLGAALTASFINSDRDSLEQRAILGAQLTVAAVASAALAFIACANYARAARETQ